MFRFLAPKSIKPPFARYSHGVEVPAGKRFKIEVRNTGHGAAEFESVQLRKETVLAPGAQSFVVIAPQEPGEYRFFDDFHQQAQGVIVAK